MTGVIEEPPRPHAVQEEALAALVRTRAAGNTAGLVVLATGLGKTWLSAFDSHRGEYERILFVAHREEILAQAMTTFRRVRPGATFGTYSGTEKSVEAQVLFASIQTLGRQLHLDRFARDDFDYIVVDEFHHAAAPTYRKLIAHFTPKFLLGLTATPERTDGGDLLSLCGENTVYRCDLFEGIRREHLSPFRYYGVPDTVDYENIPWRSTRFDEEALTTAVATQKRAENTLQHYRSKAGARTLGFCCSQRHADFMAQYFRSAGLRAVAVHSGESSSPRGSALRQLEAGQLDVVFAVDMFNEGVDVPLIDTVMMLRPTESSVVWLQQLGRGLRRATGKTHLTVIDYIGNHRIFLLKPRTLLNAGAGDRELDRALNLLLQNQTELPPGCEVTYDLEVVKILQSMLHLKVWRETNVLEAYYLEFRERHGVRPTASEALHDGYNPRAARKGEGSWLKFVKRMGDLNLAQDQALQRLGDFLDSLESTPMTKSFKMLTLLAMLDRNQIPGALHINELVTEFQRLARRSAPFGRDAGSALDDRGLLASLLEDNPIKDWTEGRGTRDRAYFDYQHQVFRTTFDLPPDAREAFAGLVRELADWRLAEYLLRPSQAIDITQPIQCRVTHAGNRPIVFLPDRKKFAHVPEGLTDVFIEGVRHWGNFAKIALNALHCEGSDGNVLPEILVRWFGPRAGLPGTQFRVELLCVDQAWHLRPVAPGQRLAPCELWQAYRREHVPSRFGLEFSTALWNQGFVVQPHDIFLFVTLNKEDLDSSFQYQDRFLSADTFQWQSQNRTLQSSKHGQLIKDHAAQSLPVHLFVRRTKKVRGEACPFTYCGDVLFESWTGDGPITVTWRLPEPVPDSLQIQLGVPS